MAEPGLRPWQVGRTTCPGRSLLSPWADGAGCGGATQPWALPCPIDA